MSANGNVIVNFPIYGQFGAIHKPDSDALSVKLKLFVKSNLLSYKNQKKN